MGPAQLCWVSIVSQGTEVMLSSDLLADPIVLSAPQPISLKIN